MRIHDIFSSIEFVDEIPDSNIVNKYGDIFPYTGRPSASISSYDKFRRNLFWIKEKYDFKDDSDSESYNNINECNQRLANNLERSYWDRDMGVIYAEITYPLTNKAIVKFVKKNPRLQLTCGMLLYAYTCAYQMVYDSENASEQECIPGMLNMATTDGKFGIWGHAIEDLVYNGSSDIEVHETYIKCHFSCDS